MKILWGLKNATQQFDYKQVMAGSRVMDLGFRV